MNAGQRIERALIDAIQNVRGRSCPPGLESAIQYAVFPGGARVRPKICLAVAAACGEDMPEVSEAAAAAIELMHCASLVHDDLPCFDDSPLRRGKPSVHQAYGEPLAVLVGDALIVLAFQALLKGTAPAPERLAPFLEIITRAVGLPAGIVAGQAWECEPQVNLDDYQQLKTGALFAAATTAGAAAAGQDPAPWRALGEQIGAAYQIVDDILDVAGNADQLGKPVHQDEALGHPSSVAALGLDGARQHFEDIMAGVLATIPPCPGARELGVLIVEESRRVLPAALQDHAA